MSKSKKFYCCPVCEQGYTKPVLAQDLGTRKEYKCKCGAYMYCDKDGRFELVPETFKTKRAAVSFARGFAVRRVVVSLRNRKTRKYQYYIMSPTTARRCGATVVWSN
jgi:hypothetical protein